MEEELLQQYAKELKRYPILNAEEQVLLAQDYINNNNTKAFDKLVKTNLRYVIKIATKYSKRYRAIGLTLSDFIQTGNIGLIIGLKKYDPARGTTPVSFAHSYIRTELDKIVGANLSPLRKMTTAVDRFMIYRRQKVINIINAEAQDKEELRNQLALETKLSKEDIKDQEEKYSLKLYSIHDFIKDDSANTFESLFSTSNEVEKDIFNGITAKDLEDRLNNIFSRIGEREADCVKELYFNDTTLKVIGKKYGVSRERIRQIIERSINKMYKIMKKDDVELINYIRVD